ncbi:MAG: hypothetical protein RL368_662 [Pseudomonadota bacterium]|jgi:addiction module HigA family antidote
MRFLGASVITREMLIMNITERKPYSPGEILQAEFMEPLDLTQRRLAELLHVSQRYVSDLIHDKRALNVDSALRLSKLFGNSPEYWLNLQIKMDLWNVHYGERDKYLEIQCITNNELI